MRFTAIDFETANGKRASICSVGLAVVVNGQVVKRVNQLIRPTPLIFHPFNVSVHGITEQDVMGAPSFADYWPTLWSHVQGPLVAHNASFDMSCLRHALEQAGAPCPKTDYYCTLVLSRLVWPQQPSHRLNDMARILGIGFQHHDAGEDAMACALVLLEACRLVGAATISDLKNKASIQTGGIYEGGYRPCKRVR